MSPDEFMVDLWSYAQEAPMAQHPWFQGILQHRWTRTQIILGEVQHYLRVRTSVSSSSCSSIFSALETIPVVSSKLTPQLLNQPFMRSRI
ncbi:MAG: hypothetical protein HY267_05405 [Deltaproteobacteria bacterium]|nr:hypothetical protein [Deltaproteobacteria bacterium]